MTSSVLRIGRVVEVSGSRVVGELESSVEDLYRTYQSRRYAVGQVGSIVKIESNDILVFGFVTRLRMTESTLVDGKVVPKSESVADAKWLEIELFGEALRTGNKESDFDFQRGVATYPLPSQSIYVATMTELSQIYRRPDTMSIHVGNLSQSASLPVNLIMDDLLGKHFAVLGTTGSGKSCAVTVLLRSILNKAKAGHIILLDPHNEYYRAFPDQGKYIDPTRLKLPHWLLNFEEAAELFIGRVEHVATSQTNILKDAVLHARKQFAQSNQNSDNVTIDTPVPYKLGDVISHIESNMPSTAAKKEPYNKVKNKIESLRQDKRFSFLVQPDTEVRDQLVELAGQYFSIPVSQKPLAIIDLSGVPSDVVDVVVSVLCRMIFDFAVWSPRPVQVPLLLVCEEAHRYAPSGSEAAFQPTRKALSRIAKEGRKYGVALGLVSQRPAELSESILSQCNTLVALRMSNAADQQFVQRTLPESVSSLVEVLPSLRNQEALVVGEGTAVPVRIQFNYLPEPDRPQSLNVPFSKRWSKDTSGEEYVEKVVKSWREQTRGEVEFEK